MHIGQLIGGLDSYIRNSIVYSSGELEYVLVHGADDHNKAIIDKQGNRIREIHIPLKREINFDDLRCIHQLVKIIRQEKPDVIHCHSAKGGIVGRIAGMLTHTPTLYTPHAFSFLSSPNKLKRGIYKSAEFLTKCGAYVLACSESELHIARHVIRYSKKKGLLWRNAVPEPEMKQKEMKMPVPQQPFIYYIGRPSYQKNPLFMVNVIAKVAEVHPEVKFFLLGVGYYSPDLDALKKQISVLELQDNVQLMEWISHSDVMAFAQQSLFYVTMARYEGLPLSVIEAMSIGKPIVASKVVGNVDCVQDGVNGYLVKLNVDKFAAAIIKLIEDPELRQQMGQESRKLFVEKFDITKRIHLLEETYKQIANKK